MRSLVQFIIHIRDIGVADQTVATVRRIRTINLVAALACIITVSYCVFYALYDAHLFRHEITFLLAMCALYAVVPMLTRTGKVEAAMWLLAGVALFHLGVINWMLGPRAGALSYLLAMPFITTLLIREGDRLSIWPIGLAVCVIFFGVSFSDRLAPFDTLPAGTQRLVFLANVIGAVLLACAVSLFYRWLIARAEAELQAEQARGDRLLRAILPSAIAEKLKDDETQTVADGFDSASVLFADIVGFTSRSARVDADQIVTDLNRVFSRIDELAVRHGVEKIKTIGDAYFAVCGLPDPMPDHGARIADFALELDAATRELAATVWPGLQFRVVIHSGPVVAGVIGRTKFAYDVWGDTINTAARLEEICEPGEILVTEAARASLPPRFRLADRGHVDLRDKGTIAVHRLMDGAAAVT